MKKKQWKIGGLMLFILLFFMPFTIRAEVTDNEYHLFENNESSIKKVKISEQKINEQDIYDRRLLIKLHDLHSFDPSVYGVEAVKNASDLEGENIFVIRIPEAFSYSKKQKEIEADHQVIYAEPDQKIVPSYTPSKNVLKNQWYLDTIYMPHAWALNQGSKDVTVAVLDTGVNKNHPDLRHRVLPGYDYVNYDKDASDDHGHGTQVAGIIAANSNSNMTGLDLQASILPVKVINADGNGSTSGVVSGIYYAIKQNVDVINMSYVNYSHSEAEEKALWDAYKKGITLVAAAGNDGWGRSGYPASYTPVISTSATDKNDQLATFSNYGKHIDLAAPGVDILSLNYIKGYKTGSGSSFSAPLVSALSGMLISQNPKWKPEDIEWALEAEANQLAKTEWSSKYGYGRINALHTFEATLPYKQTKQTDYKKATTLADKEVTASNLNHPLDVNWFTFRLTKPKKVIMTLSELEKHLDLIGTLYKYENNKLHDTLSFNSGKRGETESTAMMLNPGTYYLAVHDTYGKWSTKPYDVKLEENSLTKSFPDVSRYSTEINYLAKHGIIQGYPNGTFQPYKDITRIQAVKMILKEMKIDVNTYDAPNPNFKDISSDSYGYDAIATAVDVGFVKGKDDKTFDSYGYLTRAQLASMIVTAYQLTGESTTMFTDVNSDHWAYGLVSSLLANDITKGYKDNTFRPKHNVTRAHFSVFLYNKIQQIN